MGWGAQNCGFYILEGMLPASGEVRSPTQVAWADAHRARVPWAAGVCDLPPLARSVCVAMKPLPIRRVRLRGLLSVRLEYLGHRRACFLLRQAPRKAPSITGGLEPTVGRMCWSPWSQASAWDGGPT